MVMRVLSALNAASVLRLVTPFSDCHTVSLKIQPRVNNCAQVFILGLLFRSLPLNGDWVKTVSVFPKIIYHVFGFFFFHSSAEKTRHTTSQNPAQLAGFPFLKQAHNYRVICILQNKPVLIVALHHAGVQDEKQLQQDTLLW
ncbi:hypothetical protein XENOCAPTIV_027062 [Xenoophorus captivus]|uniref:Secreted protein n=1 Tax=Xenoophorus captivus TaxID=1517983 RepID=A0ABV0S3B4_9TELE